MSSIFFIFFPYSVYSEISNFELYLQLLENGALEKFEDISKVNPTVFLEKNEIGVSLLEYVVFHIDDDYILRGYPDVAMSLIDEDFQVTQDYKETLIDTIIYAIRSIDKDKARVDLNEDMKSDLDRSAYVELLYHVVMTSGGGQPAISKEQALFSIIIICDRELHSEKYTEKADAEALSRIYGELPYTLRITLESYSQINILDPKCVLSFAGDY